MGGTEAGAPVWKRVMSLPCKLFMNLHGQRHHCSSPLQLFQLSPTYVLLLWSRPPLEEWVPLPPSPAEDWSPNYWSVAWKRHINLLLILALWATTLKLRYIIVGHGYLFHVYFIINMWAWLTKSCFQVKADVSYMYIKKIMSETKVMPSHPRNLMLNATHIWMKEKACKTYNGQ